MSDQPDEEPRDPMLIERLDPQARLGPRRWVLWLRRRWLLLLIFAAFLALLTVRWHEIGRLLLTLVHGYWPWVLAAVLLQSAFYLVYAAEYHLSFAAMGVESQVAQLVPVLFASIFLKAVVPSGGLSSLAVFVDDAARRGQSPVRVAQGALLVLIADLVAIAPLVAFGLYYLSTRRALQPYQTVACTILLFFALTLTAIILLGRWMPGHLRRAFTGVERGANRLARALHRPSTLPAGWAERQAADYTGAARGLGERPRLLGGTLAVAFIAGLVNLTCLYTLSLAYRHPLPLGALVAAHMLNTTFSIVTVVPHGIGLAEGVMALVLTSLAVPQAEALAITVSFRGLSVWLPLAIGSVFLRRVRSFGGER